MSTRDGDAAGWWHARKKKGYVKNTSLWHQNLVCFICCNYVPRPPCLFRRPWYMLYRKHTNLTTWRFSPRNMIHYRTAKKFCWGQADWFFYRRINIFDNDEHQLRVRWTGHYDVHWSARNCTISKTHSVLNFKWSKFPASTDSGSWASEGFFLWGGGHYGIVPKFFQGGSKVVKFDFSHSETKKKNFLLKISKSRGGVLASLPPPFRHPCPQYLLHLISVKIRPNSTQWHLRPVNERWSSRGWWHEKQAENKAVENANVWNVSQTNKCTAVTGLLLRKLEEWRDNYIYRNIICVQSPTCPTSIVHHLTAVPLVSRH